MERSVDRASHDERTVSASTVAAVAAPRQEGRGEHRKATHGIAIGRFTVFDGCSVAPHDLVEVAMTGAQPARIGRCHVVVPKHDSAR